MRVFMEEQRFDQWWFRALMVVAMAATLIPVILFYSEIKEDPLAYWVVMVTVGITFLILFVIVFFFKLSTKIDEQGIHYAFWPIHLSLKTVSWHDIKECGVRQYSPIAEYGGWGYRIRLGKGSKALNVKGNMGIQLVYKNDKRLLIGTQKSDDVEKVLLNYSYKLSS